MTLALELASRIVEADFADMPSEAISISKKAILDTIGVTLAGAPSDGVRVVTAASGARQCAGPSLVMGGGFRTSMLDAALINGVASHAYDFDDCNNTMGGHPSAPILPGLWALGETCGASGREILTAYIVGVETETHIGKAVNFHHYEKGWHPTSTLGTFGAAAACSRLRGLSVEQTATALAIAASMASGIKVNFGTMTKPYHVGHCTRNGLLATLLAKEGQSASHDVFEHHQGFMEVFNGAGNYKIERALQGWADPYDVVSPGIGFKRYPCCASTHPAIDATLILREQHGLDATNVKSLLSWTHPRRLKHTNRPQPKSGFDGKFSVQFVVAKALQTGRVALNDFSDEAVRDPEVQRLLDDVITAEQHPRATATEKEIYYAEVMVETTDGRKFTQFVDAPVGRGRDHPLPAGALEAKFEDCAGEALDKAAVADLRELLLNLDNVDDIAQISRRIEHGMRKAGRKLASVT